MHPLCSSSSWQVIGLQTTTGSRSHQTSAVSFEKTIDGHYVTRIYFLAPMLAPCQMVKKLAFLNQISITRQRVKTNTAIASSKQQQQVAS